MSDDDVLLFLKLAFEVRSQFDGINHFEELNLRAETKKQMQTEIEIKKSE
jgi:hypothetical protein